MPDTPFLITVDTEGDNQWARESKVTTRNAQFLPRFQALCERYSFKPVYLTNYEMACSERFVEFARDVIARDTGEVGLHLHAWNSPPLVPLTSDDMRHHPYLPEYPEQAMRDKVALLTDLLEDRFERKMVSHRAGRWGFDRRYAAILLDHGYRVDCSVTPGLDWSANPGAPGGHGGPDFRGFPEAAYFLNPDDIASSASSGLLEVPMTVLRSNLHRHAPWLYDVRLVRRVANKVSPGLIWLCPVQTTLRVSLARNLDLMRETARRARRRNVGHLEFMVHSSELMPGGSPNFRSAAEIDQLYDGLERAFAEIAEWCHGETLAEFHAGFVGRRARETAAAMAGVHPIHRQANARQATAHRS